METRTKKESNDGHSAYLKPAIEIIKMETEGVIAGSAGGGLDFDGQDNPGVTPNTYRSFEDRVNDIFRD